MKRIDGDKYTVVLMLVGKHVCSWQLYYHVTRDDHYNVPLFGYDSRDIHPALECREAYGSVRWDGCCDFSVEKGPSDDRCHVHTCGRTELVDLLSAIQWACDEGFKLIPSREESMYHG